MVKILLRSWSTSECHAKHEAISREASFKLVMHEEGKNGWCFRLGRSRYGFLMERMGHFQYMFECNCLLYSFSGPMNQGLINCTLSLTSCNPFVLLFISISYKILKILVKFTCLHVIWTFLKIQCCLARTFYSSRTTYPLANVRFFYILFSYLLQLIILL